MPSPTTDHQHIQAILKGDPSGIRGIYDQYFTKVVAFIKRNSGSAMEAEDLFQEALIVLLHKVREPDFQLTSSFYSFLYGICRNLWLKQLRKRSGREVTLLEDSEYIDEMHIETAIFKRERQQLFREQYERLSERCRKMLHLFYQENKKMTEIAQEMGFANDNVAKKEKSKCKKRLTDQIRADQRYADLRWH